MSHWFRIKAVLAAIGLALGLSGMALESRPLVWIAVGLLGAAFLLRFLEPRVPADRADADPPSTRG